MAGWRGWGRRTASAPPPAAPIAPAHARAILRGRARGILLAANGGLTSQTALPNSLAAVQSAIDNGLPMVVLDVCQTHDEVCVLDLDHALTRDPGRPNSLKGLDYEQLRARTAQSTNGPVPTLSKALELARGLILVGLRLRTAELPDVVAVVDEADLADQVVLLVTTQAQIRAARPYLRGNATVLIGFDAPTPERLNEIESTPPWPSVITLGPATLSPANIARAQAMGARVMVHQRGTLLVRIGTRLRPYHRMGVAVILTDWPRELIQEMREINAATVEK